MLSRLYTEIAGVSHVDLIPCGFIVGSTGVDQILYISFGMAVKDTGSVYLTSVLPSTGPLRGTLINPAIRQQQPQLECS